MQDDFDGVAKTSSRLGYSDAAASMCDHVGEAVPDFVDACITFHRIADDIGSAARRADRAAVLDALDRTLRSCVGCHAAYRQEVVDPATWKRMIDGRRGHSRPPEH
jgi:cytochrome c556